MSFNNKQKIAIHSEAQNIVVIAPPGAGKTHTMVGAIQHWTENNPFVNGVAAITFTVKAAEELKERVFNNGEIHVATIHSWSMKELEKLSMKHGFRVKLLEDPQIIAIIKPIMVDYELNISSDYIVNSVLFHCLGNFNPDLPVHIKSKYEAVRQRYIDFKRNRHLYDFTDLPLYLKNKLEDFNETIYLDALFVDEFQDVDPVQLTVFDRVISEKKFFIGDPDQSIYQFRGATKDIFTKLSSDFVVYELDTNYRSYQEILDYAVYFRKKAQEGRIDSLSTDFPLKRCHIIADKGNKTPSVSVSNNDAFDILGKRTWTHKNDGRFFSTGKFLIDEFKDKEWKILVRFNRHIKKLKDAGFENVSTIHKAKGLEWDNVIVVDFELDDESDINVGYVALTRARDNMIVTSLESLLDAAKNIPSEFRTIHKIKAGF